MINHLKQWWATHLTIIIAIVSFLTPSVNDWVSKHPGTSVTIAAVWAIITHLLPSPVPTPVPTPSPANKP